VIPTRDRPDQLAQCLVALAQLAPPDGSFEVVIVDDGSSPPIDSVLASAPSELVLEPVRAGGGGPARARNAGAAAARGRYLAFVDDDCRPEPEWLRAMERRFALDGGTCIGGLIVNALPGNACSSASQLLVDFLYETFESPSVRFFCSNNLCVPAAEFLAQGGFDVAFPLPAGEDRDFCSRWQEAGGGMTFAPEAVVLHAHPMSLRGFWRQHFRYGRGAYHFHARRASRTGGPLRVEPLRFYANLFQFPFHKLRPLRAALISSLFLVAQAANTAGFFVQWAGSRGWAAGPR